MATKITETHTCDRCGKTMETKNEFLIRKITSYKLSIGFFNGKLILDPRSPLADLTEMKDYDYIHDLCSECQLSFMKWLKQKDE